MLRFLGSVGFAAIAFPAVFASGCTSSTDCTFTDVFCNPLVFFAVNLPVQPVALNVRDGGAIESGFLVGSVIAEPGLSVEVSIDGGAFFPGTVSGNSWSYALPTGADTWRHGTSHSVQVRSRSIYYSPSVAQTFTIKKDFNRDVNGDGYADYAAHDNTDASAGANSGAAYLFYGGPDALVSRNASAANLKLPGSAVADRAGERLAFGDFNGDGYGDLGITVPGADLAPGSGQGVHAVFFGSSTGLNSTAYADAEVQLYAELSSGRGLELADVNGDGFDDLIGISNNSSGTRGELYILHGRAESVGVTTVDASVNTLLVGENVGDELGSGRGTLASGDLDADGYMDVIVGSNLYPATAETGRVYILYGNAERISGGNIGAVATATITGSANSNFAYVETGDYNNDGFADLVASGPTFNSTRGAVYLFPGGTTRLSTGTADGTASLMITGDQAGARLGDDDILLKDLDGDGFDDIIASAPNYNFDASSNLGTVYVFRGSGSIPTVAPTLSGADGIYTSVTAGTGQDELGAADVNGDGIRELMIGDSGGTPGKLYIFTGISGSLPTSGSVTSADFIITGENTTQFAFTVR